jgi:hypothetical protein
MKDSGGADRIGVLALTYQGFEFGESNVRVYVIHIGRKDAAGTGRAAQRRLETGARTSSNGLQR